jgi:hypothetical protein
MLPLGAEGDPRQWISGFDESFASGEAQAFVSRRLAPFAVELARRIGQAEFKALDYEDAAQLAVRLAVSIDDDMRLGRTFQEAHARSVQQARLLLKDEVADGSGGAEGLRKMRSKAASEYGRARAGGLADPLGQRPASIAHGWTPH